MRAILSLAAILVLAACGTKGELSRPPGPPPKPILDEWFPAKPAAKAKPQADDAKDSKADDDAAAKP